MGRYEQCRDMLDAITESWDDLLIDIAELYGATIDNEWVDADRETIVEEFDPWQALKEITAHIEELTAALKPFAYAWPIVKKSMTPSGNTRHYYMWKPNIDGVVGVSFEDARIAHRLLNKRWEI